MSLLEYVVITLECCVPLLEALCHCRRPLFQIVLGLMCPGGLCGGGKSQNEAKSRRFGMDLPSRAFYEGVNPKTILNNCHEYTKRYHNSASPQPPIFIIAHCHHCHHRQRRLLRRPLPPTPAACLALAFCCLPFAIIVGATLSQPLLSTLPQLALPTSVVRYSLM